MAKYIENKKINSAKANDIKDFKDISEAAWKLLLAIYNSKQNSFFADSYNNSFKQKVTH